MSNSGNLFEKWMHRGIDRIEGFDGFLLF